MRIQVQPVPRKGGGTQYVPIPFKPVGRKPVPGGRWKIRRLEGTIGRPWSAWSEGRAGRFRRNFETQSEAILWATWVAANFKQIEPLKSSAVRVMYEQRGGGE